MSQGLGSAGADGHNREGRVPHESEVPPARGHLALHAEALVFRADEVRRRYAAGG